MRNKKLTEAKENWDDLPEELRTAMEEGIKEADEGRGFTWEEVKAKHRDLFSDDKDCVKAYDIAKSRKQEFVPAEKMFKRIEKKRKGPNS